MFNATHTALMMKAGMLEVWTAIVEGAQVLHVAVSDLVSRVGELFRPVREMLERLKPEVLSETPLDDLDKWIGGYATHTTYLLPEGAELGAWA